jgi:hypothetical protein
VDAGIGAGGRDQRRSADCLTAGRRGDKADDYFGIELVEELTRALSKTGVRVIGRVSAGALLHLGSEPHLLPARPQR